MLLVNGIDTFLKELVRSVCGRATTFRTILSGARSGPAYEDYLEELSGDRTFPGKAFAMLRKETSATHGRVNEGEATLTFRFWDLSGLNAAASWTTDLPPVLSCKPGS
jgi:hypothetical protein